MTRYGFGEKTGESKKQGLPQYENGHVDVSGSAIKHAVEQFPELPPKQAIGAMLADGQVGENNVSITWENVFESLQEIDGVYEKEAEEIMSVLQSEVNV